MAVALFRGALSGAQGRSPHGISRLGISFLVGLNSAMKIKNLILLASLALALPVWAQDSVTVPKSRLDELQRKEAELEKLKGELSKAKSENVQLKKQQDQDSAKIASAPLVDAHLSPPIGTLAALKDDETISALDLGNHYRADAAAADQRYRAKRFRVEGQIVAFEKAPMIRPYRFILKTADPET